MIGPTPTTVYPIRRAIANQDGTTTHIDTSPMHHCIAVKINADLSTREIRHLAANLLLAADELDEEGPG